MGNFHYASAALMKRREGKREYEHAQIAIVHALRTLRTININHPLCVGRNMGVEALSTPQTPIPRGV